MKNEMGYRKYRQRAMQIPKETVAKQEPFPLYYSKISYWIIVGVFLIISVISYLVLTQFIYGNRIALIMVALLFSMFISMSVSNTLKFDKDHHHIHKGTLQPSKDNINVIS